MLTKVEKNEARDVLMNHDEAENPILRPSGPGIDEIAYRYC